MTAATVTPPFHVAITGATGLIGSALARELRADGHRVTSITRNPSAPGDVGWDPDAGRLDAPALDGVDAVVHLAAESLDARWTRERMRRIRESRIRGTSLLARTLAGLQRPPKALVSISAVGIYGDRGDEILGDGAAPGTGFLAEVAVEWERAAEPARAGGIRVTHPRLAAVLAPGGGMLDRLLLPFRLGVGGPIGDGSQWMPLVALADAVGAIRHALATPNLTGPFNVALPEPVTNREFTRALGRALHRPAIIPAPLGPLRLWYGGLVDALLLASERVIPVKLVGSGYRFRHPGLDAALRAGLGGTG